MRPRAAGLILALCAGILIVSFLAALVWGPTDIPLPQVLRLLARRLGLGGGEGLPSWQAVVLWEVRMPRVVVAACVGAALALCGAVMQALFRNPLASPDVLGVSAGAALGAVAAMYLGWAALNIWIQPFCSTAGAALTGFLVYGIATRRGHSPVGTLLLAGVAFNTLNGALTAFFISLALADFRIGGSIMHWTLGGLDASTWDKVWIVLPALLLGSAFLYWYARDLDALLLGEQHAASVGVDVPRVRRNAILATALVTGTAVAVSGAVGFVGLVVPHILRALLGPGHRGLLPGCLLGGGAFLVLVDLFARTLIAPEEIRLGVITAAVGAPFFLFLLLQRRKEGLW